MTVDIVIRGNTRKELVEWGKRNNVIKEVENDQGETVNQLRNGFYWSQWNGSAVMMKSPLTSRGKLPVAIVQEPRFGFTIPATRSLPGWVDDTVTANDADGNVVGTYDREQGGYAVFRATGDVPAVDDELEIFSGPTFWPGFYVLFRFSENRMKEYRALKKIVRTEGVQGDAGGIRYFSWDGIEFAKLSDIEKLMEQQGTPGHEFAGGAIKDSEPLLPDDRD